MKHETNVYFVGLVATVLCRLDLVLYASQFNHRRSSFSGRCFPTVEHSAAERHVGVVNVCF